MSTRIKTIASVRRVFTILRAPPELVLSPNPTLTSRTGTNQGAALKASFADIIVILSAVAWDNIGLRLIQIARGREVWVLDMWKIKAFPRELIRILGSADIPKVGVGIIRDILVIWDDLRFEMKNLVDAGMMAKLLLAEKYPKLAYGNLSLKTSVEDVLGYSISKELSESDWSLTKLSEEQKEYAALDALASLRLHEVLVDALAVKSKEIKSDIPAAWYTFNTKIGEPTRLKRDTDGMEIVWKPSDCTWYGGGRYLGSP
ncbi:ribonuclease H-like domain-containing protein [Mycena leptocephala]|nr:ribonuclease H-like domain-containing protein [Mycena leptocephala]